MSRMRARNTLFLAPKAKPNERVTGEKVIQPGEIPALLRSSPLKEKFYRDFSQILLDYLIITCDLPSTSMSNVIKDKTQQVSHLLTRFLKANGREVLLPAALHCAKLLLGDIIETNEEQLLINKVLAKRIILTAYSRYPDMSWAAIMRQPSLVLQSHWVFRSPFLEQYALIGKSLAPHYKGLNAGNEVKKAIDKAMEYRGGRSVEALSPHQTFLGVTEGRFDTISWNTAKKFEKNSEDEIDLAEVNYHARRNKPSLLFFLLMGIAIAYGFDLGGFSSFLLTAVMCFAGAAFLLAHGRQNFYLSNLKVNLQNQLMSGLEKGIDNLEKLEGGIEEREIRVPSRSKRSDQDYQPLTEEKAAELRNTIKSLAPVTMPVQDVEVSEVKPKQLRSTSSTTSETKVTDDKTEVITWHFDNTSVSYDPNRLIDANSRDHVVDLHSYIPTCAKFNGIYYVHFREDEFKKAMLGMDSVISKKFKEKMLVGSIVRDEGTQGYVYCNNQNEMEEATFKIKVLGRGGNNAHRLYFFKQAETKHNGRNAILLGNPKLGNFK